MTFWRAMPVWLPIPGWMDMLDIAIVAAFGWFAIRYFRRTRARPAFAGLALLGLVYFVARELELRLSTTLLQGFFAVVVLVLVVVFQEDLRRFFEQLGGWWHRRSVAPKSSGIGIPDVLARTVARLAATRCGALIVVPGTEPLTRHIEGGIRLDGYLTEPLLLSIFDSSSPGHDGAVLLDGTKIASFGVHLPLSANHAAVGPGGTRHAAALGLAERCDAICIVVSEERGTISIARDGEIRVLARAEDLIAELESAFAPTRVDDRPWWVGGAVREALLATIGATILWGLLVAGSDIGETTIPASIELTNLPVEMKSIEIEPPVVEVTVRGLRRKLLLAERDEIVISIDAYLAKFGRRTFMLQIQDVQTPDGIEVVEIIPEKIRLSVDDASGSGTAEVE